MTRLLSRTPSARARTAHTLLALAAAAALSGLLVATVRLPLGETVLLPGTEQGGVRTVSGDAGELSLAVDVRNGGLLPVRVDGVADLAIGPYAARLGRGGPGGGVPEQEVFEPFVLWPGQQRLLVLHLTRAGDPAPLDLTGFRVATTVLGVVGRDLEVQLPTTLQVS
ncbi:MAG: hypothetical protein JWN08_3118 [Frankiales bacterium]|nr:hypothetical protein [Frankiales bacterium]